MGLENTAGWLDLGVERGPSEALLERSVALLDEVADGRPRLRWYVPTDAAVVLGRGQRDALDVAGHVRLQRPSGGGAVLMDDDFLSLDVLLPAAHPWLADPDLGAVFEPIGAAWADGLRALGVTGLDQHLGPATASRLGPEAQRPLAEVCYASLGRGELTVDGRKLVGLSQRRRRQGALIQCGIHRRWRPAPLIEALGVGEAATAIEAAAIGLDDLIQPPVSDVTVVRAVTSALREG